ncbi:MAG: hypothetical protein OXF20_03635 [Gammaproteobacteria bacterium]|nr:hypothetical protein [Gammaproteobacteria bacterium]
MAKALLGFTYTHGGWLFLGIDEASEQGFPIAGKFVGMLRESVCTVVTTTPPVASDSVNQTSCESET